jgi:hypothetical protein
MNIMNEHRIHHKVEMDKFNRLIRRLKEECREKEGEKVDEKEVSQVK